MEKAQNQLNIWKLILSGHEATSSWGIDSSTLSKLENGISFRLEGEKHNGWVEIIFDEIDNCFNVFIRNQQDMKLIETVAISELISAIRNQPKDLDAAQLENVRKDFGFTIL